MTNIARPVGEDDLQAWVDGRLTPERAKVVDAYLEAHPVERARLAQYRDQKRTLREALAGEGGPIPARLQIVRLTASSRHRGQPRFVQLAAAIILLILGGAGGWTAHEIRGALGGGVTTAATAMAEDAIAAHRTFAVEVLHPVEVTATQEEHLGNWLSNRLGRRLIIPNLDRFGLQLIGGRLLPSENGPAAQLMYNDAKGSRFTVYVRLGAPGETRIYLTHESVGASLWIDEGFGCVIVGPADRELLGRIGEMVYKEMLLEENSQQRKES